jgi:hypothetical protein
VEGRRVDGHVAGITAAADGSAAFVWGPTNTVITTLALGSDKSS